MIYIDSNILIFARLDDKMIGNICKAVMEKLDDGKFAGATSLLTIDEVVWEVKKKLGYKEGIQYGKLLLGSAINLLPVEERDVAKSFELMEHGLDPRDAIHAATCLNYRIFSILTTDPDFKKVKELEAIAPAGFLENL